MLGDLKMLGGNLKRFETYEKCVEKLKRFGKSENVWTNLKVLGKKLKLLDNSENVGEI